MKNVYKQMTKAMALVALFLMVGVNAWGRTTIYDGSAPTGWSNGAWTFDPSADYFTLGQNFKVKSDASGTDGLTYYSSYYALCVKYRHTFYMICEDGTAGDTKIVHFKMQGPNNTAHKIEFKDLTTGHITVREVAHQKDHVQQSGTSFTVHMVVGHVYEFIADKSEIDIKLIEYLEDGVDFMELSENTDNASNISALRNHATSTIEVGIDRTLKANKWNTFCCPVTYSGSAVLDEFFNTDVVYVLDATSYEASTKTLRFVSSNTLPANTPVLIKPTADVEDIVFEETDIVAPNSADDLIVTSTDGTSTVKFVGLYGTENIYTADHSKLFLSSDGSSLLYPSSSSAGTIKGFRAYFDLSESNGVKSFRFEDDPTGIIMVEDDPFQENGNVYTIDGRNMGNAKNLSRGLYIQNGRKFIVK